MNSSRGFCLHSVLTQTQKHDVNSSERLVDTSPPSSAFLFCTFTSTDAQILTLSQLLLFFFLRVTFNLAVNHTFHLRKPLPVFSPHCRSSHRLHLPFTSTAELQSRDQKRLKRQEAAEPSSETKSVRWCWLYMCVFKF